MPRFTNSDGLSLAYEDTGTGRPILCLPGLTRNARDFDDLKAVQPPGSRLIVLTARGREPSDWDPQPDRYQVPIEARDAVELLDHLGLNKAVIVGTSRGGLQAMIIAATAKERLAGVLLNDIGPEYDGPGLERIYDYIGRRPTGKTYDAVAAGLAETMGDQFPTLGPADWRRLAERWFVEDAAGVGLRYDPALRDTVIAARGQPIPDLWPLFDALEGLPLACLRGVHSDLLSPATFAEMKRRRPDMIAVEVPDRGHVPFLDEAESQDALARLLAACP